MVKAVTNFGRSGLSNWLVQRVSAVILLAYILFLVCSASQGLDHTQWKALFYCTPVQIFSTIALFSVVAHSWIGVWSVLTDYVTERFFKLELGIELGAKAAVLRLLLAVGTVLLMAIYTLWGLKILWGM